MKKYISIITITLLTVTFAVGQQSTKATKEAAEKKAATERKRSLGGVRTENDLKDDKGDLPANQTVSKNKEDQGRSDVQSGEVIPSNEDQPQAQTKTEKKAEKSNAPAVIQRTSSESGSPSILAEDNGNGRDGTNNVQRAKPNIAGAEVPGNMNLSKKNTEARTVNPNGKKIRKEEEQPARITSKGKNTGGDQIEAQNKRGQQAVAPSSDTGKKQVKQSNKSKRKNRRNGEKDSGK